MKIMMRKRNISLLSIVIILVLAILSLITPSQSQATNMGIDSIYDIGWWTVDSGGGRSISVDEQYVLYGTIGQHDVGYIQNGDFTLHGGFWVKGILKLFNSVSYFPLIFR